MRKYLFCFCFCFVLLLLSFIKVVASGCDKISPCAAYSEAEAVFVGKLLKIIKEDKADSPSIRYRISFQVERTFKGKPSRVEILDFINWGNRKYLPGRKYLVYKEENNGNNPCNSTHLYSKDDIDLTYAENLSKKKFVLAVGLKIKELTAGEIKGVKLFVQHGNSRRSAKVDDIGRFNLFLGKKGIYFLEIHLPFKASIEVSRDNIVLDAEIVRSDNTTIVKYRVDSAETACDYRMISYYKD